MDRYVLAVKRSHRAEVTSDWRAGVGKINGVEVQPPASADRIIVEATAQGVASIRKKYGGFLHIEPEIQHSFGIKPPIE